MLLINTPKSFCSKVGNMYFVTMNGYAIGILPYNQLFRTKDFNITEDIKLNVNEVTKEELMMALKKVDHSNSLASITLERLIKLTLYPI